MSSSNNTPPKAPSPWDLFYHWASKHRYKTIIVLVGFLAIVAFTIWASLTPEQKNSLSGHVPKTSPEFKVYPKNVINPTRTFALKAINHAAKRKDSLTIKFDNVNRAENLGIPFPSTDDFRFAIDLVNYPNFDISKLDTLEEHSIRARFEDGPYSDPIRVIYSYNHPFANANLQTEKVANSDSVSIKLEGSVASLQQDSANIIEVSISFNYTDTSITTNLSTTLKHQNQIGYNYRSFSYKGSYLPTIESGKLMSISFTAVDAAQNKFTREFSNNQIKTNQLLSINNIDLDSLFATKPIDSKINQYSGLSPNTFHVPPTITKPKSKKPHKVHLASFPNSNYGLPENSLEDIAIVTPKRNRKDNYDFTITFKERNSPFGYLSMSVCLVEIPQKSSDGPISPVGSSQGFRQEGHKFFSTLTFNYPQIHEGDQRPESFAIVIVVTNWSEESSLETYYYSIPIEPEIIKL